MASTINSTSSKEIDLLSAAVKKSNTAIIVPVVRRPIENPKFQYPFIKSGSSNLTPEHLLSKTALALLRKSKAVKEAKQPLTALACLTQALKCYQLLSQKNVGKDHKGKEICDRIISCYERILDIRPETPPSDLAMAHMCKAGIERFPKEIRNYHYELASKLWKGITANDSQNAQAYYHLAKCSLALGKLMDAHSEISMALNLAGNEVNNKDDMLTFLRNLEELLAKQTTQISQPLTS